MSAPPRGARDGGMTRGSTTPSIRARGRGRGSTIVQPRGRGRGSATPATNTRAEGLLQGLQSGSLNKRGNDNLLTRGARSRGATSWSSTSSRGQFANKSKTINTQSPASSTQPSVPAPSSHKDFMKEINNKYQSLKQKRDGERKEAIANGFLADPEKKTSLDKAITTVGTSTTMCPEFERAERIVQNMVDKSEKIRSDESGRDIPSEDRMVKRFRRSAAGYDEQLPSDIRTPATLKVTLDYLLDDVIGGGEKLASVHKFVWDRTRGIRNDFSIQQVTKKEDVSIAVECLERIARFHILSLHQLSNLENLIGEHFDAHQDREQLNNTLLSLIYYYDDNRTNQPFPNEAEFRAYCILFELQSQHPDLEDRMQSWPTTLLKDGRVKTAFKLYASAGSTMFEQGPLRPTTPFCLAQSNSGSFWNVLQSKQVSYLMACVAEIYFGQIRYTALQSIWTAITNAPVTTRAKNHDWTLAVLASTLAFDTEEQALEFCEAFGLTFSTDEHDLQYLDVSANLDSLDKSSIPTRQIFSHDIVEAKRYNRTLVAVINGVTVAQAIRLGLLITPEESQVEAEEADENSIFIPEEKSRVNPFGQSSASIFNPQAPTFTPGSSNKPSAKANGVGFSPPQVSSAPSLAPLFPFAAAQSAIPATGQVVRPVSQFSTPSAIYFGKDSSGSNAQATPDFLSGKPFQFSGFASATDSAPSASPGVSLAAPDSQQATPTSAPQLPNFSWQTPVDSFQNTAKLGDTPLFASRAGTSASTLFPSPKSNAASPNQAVTQNQPVSTPFFQTSSPFQFQSPPSQPTSPPPTTFQFQAPAPLPQFTPPPPSTASSGFNPSFSFDQPSQGKTEQRQEKTHSFPPLQREEPSFLSSDNPLYRSPRQEDFTPATSSTGVRHKSSSSLSNQAGVFPKPTSLGLSAGQTSSASLQSKLQDPTLIPNPQTTDAPPPSLPKNPPFTAADRERVINILAQLAFLQPQGLLEQYMAYLLPNICTGAFKDATAERVARIKRAERREILAKKYIAIWRKNAWHNLLTRKAKIRRQNLRNFEIKEKQEELAKAKMEAEVKEILRAQAEGDAIKAKHKENLDRRMEIATTMHERLDRLEAENERVQKERFEPAVRKRKSIHLENPKQSNQQESPRKVLRAHKRSRTATDIEPVMLDRWTSHTLYLDRNSPPGRPPGCLSRPSGISIFSGRRSIFGVPQPTPQYTNAWQGRPLMDNTHTDYFRLKALGVDPDTPMRPETAETLKIRQQREADAKVAARAKSRIRPSTGKPRPSSRTEDLQPAASLPPIPSIERSLSASSPPSHTSPPANFAEIDDLLRRLRETRAQMEEGTEWFKSQTAAMGKEIEEHELLQGTSSNDSLQTSTNGLARSANGYEYMPPNLKPGQKLNRTEQRLRLTGGHGLATKPIGGTPGYKSKSTNLPPSVLATSQHSPLRNSLINDDESPKADRNGTVKKRRKHGEPTESYYSEPEGNKEEEVDLKHLRPADLSAKARRNQVADPRNDAVEEHDPEDHYYSQKSSMYQPKLNGTSESPSATLGAEDVYSDEEYDEEEDEEELLEEEDDDMPQDADDNHIFSRHEGDDGDIEETEDYDEEDSDEEDYDGEDGEDDENESGASQPNNYLQLPRMIQQEDEDARRSPFSRGTSGTGMSADDAVLLDSD